MHYSGVEMNKKFCITIICNETACDNLQKILKYFEMMGDLGMTRDFMIDDYDEEWFTFDGDGTDRIESIEVRPVLDTKHKKSLTPSSE